MGAIGPVACVTVGIATVLFLTVFNAPVQADSFSALGIDSSSARAASPTVNVTFTETGLPAGLTWGVTLGGMTKSASSGSDINFTETPGNYTLRVDAPLGFVAFYPPYVLVGPSGSLYGIGFSRQGFQGYNLTFIEIGLPTASSSPGWNWSVTVDGVAESAGNRQLLTSLRFVEPNGTHFFAASAPGYNATPASGSVDVAGQSIIVNITFTVNNSGPICGNNCPPLGSPPPGANSGLARALLRYMPYFVGALALAAVIGVFAAIRGRRVGAPADVYQKYVTATRFGPNPASSVGLERSSDSNDEESNRKTLAELLK